MQITETHGPFGKYVNLVGRGHDMAIRMEKPTTIESLMHAASEMRAKQFRLQGLAEMLEEAASQLVQKETDRT